MIFNIDLKRFFPYKNMSGFERFKEAFPTEEKFCSLLVGEKIVIQNMNMFLRLGIHMKWKR